MQSMMSLLTMLTEWKTNKVNKNKKRRGEAKWIDRDKERERREKKIVTFPFLGNKH